MRFTSSSYRLASQVKLSSVKKIYPETGGWFLEAYLVMTNFYAKATNSIAKWTNSIAKVTNSFANTCNMIARGEGPAMGSTTVATFSYAHDESLLFTEHTIINFTP